ncbi:UvrD-helicase domain-containing protein [Brachyspira pilosicoli]|uniref:DNA 3'-5' helicase n=1 Tax=Brachyspira pilosicoli TaxID=52584 RepID=A0A5C8F1Q4_BRAPL|nr:UvrD-helicase domain-containing protein [Brachyspira pilosicoli]TXJ43996.1 DEAD/DEAH box helicase [Brachyspira pilosicoli]
MKLNSKQKEIIDLFLNEGICFVSASAGTGKTTTITEAYLKLLENKKQKVSNIVVITFTKAAANEMLIRIRRKIREKINEGKDSQYWKDIYKEILTNARISTIHSFANSIVKEYSIYLNMPPKITILEENNDFYEVIYNEILELLNDSELSEDIRKNYRIFTDESKNQFINDIFNFLIKIKPRLETIKTFTEKANEILNIKLYNDVYNSMFVTMSYLIDNKPQNKEGIIIKNIVDSINDSIDIIKKIKDIENIENDDLYYNVLDSLKNITKNRNLGQTKHTDFKNAFDKLKKSLIPNFEKYIKIQKNKEIYKKLINFIKEAYNRLENTKRQMGVYSHEDMISKAIEALENEAINKEIRDNINTVILDEAQDTSKLQFSFINLIVFGDREIEKETTIKDKKILIVGDRKQSIYRFRNADLNVFTNAQDIFKDYVRYLQDNYRSKEMLINFFNDIFENIVFKDDNIKYKKDDNLISGQNDNTKNKLVSLLVFNNNVDEDIKLNTDSKTILEAYAIAKFIKTNLKNDYKNTAMLLQTFSRLNIYLSVFAEEKIPYYVDGGNGFYDRVEIFNLIICLKYLVLKDYSLLQSLLMSELFDIKIANLYDFSIELKLNENEDYNLYDYFSLNDCKEKTIEIAKKKKYYNELKKAKELLNSIELKISTMSSYDAIDTICVDTNYYNYLMLKEDAEISYANIEKLKKLAYDFENRAGVNIYDFVISLDMNAKDISYATVPKLSVDAIRIMTIHKSKGLEFNNVFLAGTGHYRALQNNMFDFVENFPYIEIPIHGEIEEKLKFFSKDDDYNSSADKSEKKRLLYVALTRAKERLIISGESRYKNFKEPNSYRNYIDSYHNFNIDDSINNTTDDLIHVDDNTNEFMDYYSYGILKNANYDLNEIYINNLEEINKKIDSININSIIKEKTKKIKYVNPSEVFEADFDKSVISRLLNKNISVSLDDDKNFDLENLETIKAIDMGILMHDLLEHFDFDEYKLHKDNYIEKIKNNALKQNKHYDEKDLRKRLDKYFTNFINNKHIANIINGKELIVSREHKFQERKLIENRTEVINAKIDLITKNISEEYFILDYKTTKYSKEKEEKYTKQLEMYKDIVKKAFNINKNIDIDLIFLG